MSEYVDEAVIGKDFQFLVADALGGDYVQIGNIETSSIPEVSCEMLDSTHMQTPNNTMTKKSSGWNEVGEIPGNLFYNKADYAAILVLVGDDTKFYRLIAKDGGTWTGPGCISKFGGDQVPLKGLIKQKITVTPLGEFTFSV